LIVIQDESIAGWKSSKMRGFGKKVQRSIMGGIISSLKNKPETLVVDKYFPSTQLCSACGLLNKLSLDQRTYSCSCGYSEDRDVHAARNILNEGLKQLGREPIKAMPVEKWSSGPERSKMCFVEAGSLWHSTIGSSQ
jgi:putative transposase